MKAKQAREFMFSYFFSSYADVLSLELISRNVLQLLLKNEQLILHSQKAQQIKATVEIFLKELKQVRTRSLCKS